VDVASQRILLCTKAKATAAEICSIPLDLKTAVQIRAAETVCKLAVPYATAMDISPDGQRLAIVNPLSGLLFEKSVSQNWSDVFASTPQILTLPPWLRAKQPVLPPIRRHSSWVVKVAGRTFGRSGFHPQRSARTRLALTADPANC
jgi:hypothetical protein